MNITQDFLNIATLFISAGAIILSLFAFLTTRKHNRKTVSPVLTFNILDNKKEKLILYKLKNTGFGPARITSIHFIYNNKKNEHIDQLLFGEHRDLLLNYIKHDEENKGFFVNHESHLGVNDEITVYQFNLHSEEGFKIFQRILDKIKVVIKIVKRRILISLEVLNNAI